MNNYVICYREHRGGLKESMKTLVKFDSFVEFWQYLVNYYNSTLQFGCIGLCDISISPYSKFNDERINWPYTDIVCIKGNGVGFVCVKLNNCV